jgi:hypothetical protein
MVKIPKSVADTFGGQFEVMVAAHAHDVKAWREHMARVEKDEASGVHADQAHARYPAPEAPAVVASAVNENGDVDYAVFDDSPSAEDLLPAKRARLLTLLLKAENEALGKIVTPGRARLNTFRAQDIKRADDDRIRAIGEQVKDLESKAIPIEEKIANIPAKGLLKKIISGSDDEQKAALQATAVDLRDRMRSLIERMENRESLHAEQRPAEDTAFIQDQKAQAAAIEAVLRISAEVHAEIDDLTIDSVDAFTIPDLS